METHRILRWCNDVVHPLSWARSTFRIERSVSGIAQPNIRKVASVRFLARGDKLLSRAACNLYSRPSTSRSCLSVSSNSDRVA
jgi:hypothetical protein